MEDFPIDSAAAGTRVRVDLRPHPMIVGRVVPAAGEKLLESDVRAVLIRPNSPDSEVRADDEPSAESTLVRTPDDGWFAFGAGDPLEAGLYEVTATPWRFGSVRATTRVTVATDPVCVLLQLPPIDAREGVTIRVFDADGAVVSPRVVTLDLQDDAHGGRGGGCTFLRRNDGSMWIPTALSLPPGRRWTDAVVWIFTDVGVKSLRLPRILGNDSIRLDLDRPSDLTVELDDRPLWLTGAGVHLVARHPFSPGIRTGAGTAAADRDGVAHLGAVQPGTYALMLTARLEGWDVAVELGDVEVHSGFQRIVRRLPRLHRTEIHHGGGMLGLYRVGRPWESAQWSTTPSETGTVLSPGMPEGEYEVRQGGRAATVKLPTASVRLR